jgi:hypothetical protein
MKKGLAAGILGAAGVIAPVACRNVNVPPHQAAGFHPERLAQLSPGMLDADIIALVGQPLRREFGGQGPQTRELLTYAELGALIKGDVSIGSRAYECLVWLHAGRLEEVYFYSAATHRYCWCRKDACSPEWAEPCQATMAR